MPRILRQLISDYAGLVRICGFCAATKWLSLVALHFRECRIRRDLQTADIALAKNR